MNVIEKQIGEIFPYENNPRNNESAVDAVAESIKQFGFKQPIVVDKDNVIIVGHTRWEAAQRLGLESVPVLVAEDLTEQQAKAYRLADNKTNELSGWDFLALDEELDGILDFDMTDFGFDDEEPEPIEVTEDDYDVEEPAEARTKSGDLWQLGKHRLICGDCTDAEVVSALMGGQQAAISFTSPPYNLGSNAKLSLQDASESRYENDTDEKTDEEYLQLLAQSSDNMTNNSRWAFINLQLLAGSKRAIIDWLHMKKDELCDIAIWDKGHAQPAMAARVMNTTHEYVFILSKESNSRAVGTNNFRGTVSTIYNGSGQHDNKNASVHRATFPLHFPAHYISTFTNKNESVLDPFGGSGTTLIACEQLDRVCYMCELDPKYCDVIIDRWETFTGEKAVLINA